MTHGQARDHPPHATASGVYNVRPVSQPRAPHESTDPGHSDPHDFTGSDSGASCFALCVLWSREEPARVGEVLLVPPGDHRPGYTVGRATEVDDRGALPLALCQLRPFSLVTTGPLQDPRISRWQLAVRPAGDGLHVELRGRGGLLVHGAPAERATVRVGDLLELTGRLLLLVTRRPLAWPRESSFYPTFPFGQADPHGLVGESPAAWALRRELSFAASRGEHTLVVGPSGAGKELVVRAIHRASRRGERPLVARNAATIPDTLIDAELFGNLRNYPNPGIPDRPGLLGEADGGTLFLDEIGELPAALQARLLRVMDCGEYQRLGEARRRTTDVRLIAATNRDPAILKHDLLARFSVRLTVPGFAERPDDIPLIARHLVRQILADDPAARARLCPDDEPRLSPQLITAAVRRSYNTHTRELSELLLRALAASPGPTLEGPPLPTTSPPPSAPSPDSSPPEPDEAEPPGVTREQILAALDRCDGVRDRAWRELGLTSRYQLKRLLKRHNIA